MHRGFRGSVFVFLVKMSERAKEMIKIYTRETITCLFVVYKTIMKYQLYHEYKHFNLQTIKSLHYYYDRILTYKIKNNYLN